MARRTFYGRSLPAVPKAQLSVAAVMGRPQPNRSKFVIPAIRTSRPSFGTAERSRWWVQGRGEPTTSSRGGCAARVPRSQSFRAPDEYRRVRAWSSSSSARSDELGALGETRVPVVVLSPLACGAMGLTGHDIGLDSGLGTTPAHPGRRLGNPPMPRPAGLSDRAAYVGGSAVISKWRRRCRSDHLWLPVRLEYGRIYGLPFASEPD
jgi:hypothetical protein